MNIQQIYEGNILPELSDIINEIIVVGKFNDYGDDYIKSWIYNLDKHYFNDEYNIIVKQIADISGLSIEHVEYIFPYYFDELPSSKTRMAAAIVNDYGDQIDFIRMKKLYEYIAHDYKLLFNTPFLTNTRYAQNIIKYLLDYYVTIKNYMDVIEQFKDYHPKSIKLHDKVKNLFIK